MTLLKLQLLENSLLPLLHRFPEGEKIFQHDNALIHTAKQTTKFFEQAQISVMEWPPQSPYLNFIEHLWDAINRMKSLHIHMAESNSGTNLESLHYCIQESWSNVSPDKLFNVLQSMPTRINAVIQQTYFVLICIYITSFSFISNSENYYTFQKRCNLSVDLLTFSLRTSFLLSATVRCTQP